MKGAKQTTLRDHTAVFGVGVHSGLSATVTLHPADANSGITFLRTGIPGRPEREIKADVRAVTATEFATVLGDSNGPLCSTAEHLLAALRGLGVDNVLVEIDGAEVPIMDGSAAPFVRLIESVGAEPQDVPRRAIKIMKPVEVSEDGSLAALLPDSGFSMSFEIDFDNPLIRHQDILLSIDPEAFNTELAPARTFGMLDDWPRLKAAGLARGGSLENAVVISGDRVLNAGGLRFADEFVRHKLVDAIGDLSLAGGAIIGHFRGSRSGHALTRRLLASVFADPDAWCYTTMFEAAELGVPVWAASARAEAA